MRRISKFDAAADKDAATKRPGPAVENKQANSDHLKRSNVSGPCCPNKDIIEHVQHY